MKFQMIFEGVDRASKIMNKLMNAEKKTARAMQAGAKASAAASAGSTKASEKQASALAKIGNAGRTAYRAVAAGANAAANATVALHRKTVTLAKTGLSQVGSGAGKVFRGLALGAGIAVAAFGSASLAAGSLVGVASEFEKFQTILETTEGSAAKAVIAMGWVSNFAAKTPYELSEVTEAFVKLRSYGLDPTKGMLQSLGDTSAAMGKPLVQAVEAMADAVTGENERLKEFGIVASKTGKKITYEYTNAAGKTVTASVKAGDRLAIQAKLMQIFSEKYGGAMEKLSATWDGMVSNLSDIWAQFQLSVMSAGLFDWMKAKLQFVLDTVNAMKADGSLDAWAKNIGDRIMMVLEAAWQFATRTYEILSKLGEYLSVAADYVGGWENLAIVLAGMAFGPVLISTAAGIVQIAIGLSMLSAALFANPIVLAVAAIVAAAALIYIYWEPIKAFFVDLWSSISAGATQAWTAVNEWLGFDPMAAMSSSWSSVSETVSNAWAAIPPFTWSDVLTALDWSPYITSIDWAKYLPDFSWPTMPNLSWPELPDFSWPEIPSFKWPELPSLELPELPDIAGYIGAFSDKAMAAIDGVATRLGGAWTKVKSAFSFGGDDAQSTMSMADAAALRDNATVALQKVNELDAAAARIVPTVTGAIGQARGFLAGVSFYDQGAALMETMAAGMRARAAVVVQEIQRMAQMVRDHLPSSPAKVGPLSDIHRLKFGETIAGSIRAAPMVKAMRAASAATMAAAAISAPSVATASTAPDAARARAASASVQSDVQQRGGAGSAQGSASPLVYSPTIHLAGASESDKRDFAAMLREHSREIARLMDEENRRRDRTST